MLTSGYDVEFERPVPKLYQLSKSIIAMLAGDAGVQDEICGLTVEKIGKEQIGKEKITVRDVVNIYCAELAAYHKLNGERSVLSHLGLDMESFVQQQHEIGRELSDKLILDLEDVRDSAGIETIIAGIDRLGPHIYTIDNDGSALCQDSVGFASIGVGARHAESQFMLRAYSSRFTLANASFLAFIAKRRAEVAPGVGKYTDLFAIDPEGHIHNPINPVVLRMFEQAYDHMDREQNAAVIRAEQSVRESIEDDVRRQASKNAPPIEPPPA
jgi:hypothetical protein